MKDIYDLLATLLQHAARSGLAEHLVHDGETVIEKFDPKIAEKKQAAEQAAAQEAADRAEFEAFKRFQAGRAADTSGGAPASSTSPPPVSSAPAAAPAPPVVTG